jgi:membrane fusion protein, macrolide-specific efflux system
MHSHRPNRFRLIALTIAVALLAVAGLSWWYVSAKANDQSKWVTAKATRGDIEDTTTALGTLQPLNYVDVGTQVSGQLRRIFVQIGDQVTEGQPLAEIDPTIYGTKVAAGQAQLQSLRAQLAEKEALQALADQLYARQQRMLSANATSQEAFQSAQTALKAAQAQINQLRGQIAQIESTLKGDQANLGYTKIYAPMTGTVVSQTARQGQTLNSSQQAPIIVRIADLQTMTVWTQVSEADVAKLKLGQPVYFTTLGQPDRRRYATLRQILPTPEVLNNVVLYDALFDVPNPEGDLGIQMSAQVFFVHASARDAVVVPVSALAAVKGRREKGKPDTIMVMNDGVPESRQVVVGVRNRVQAQIVSGLNDGDEVVIGQRQAEARKAGPQQAPGGGYRPPAR